MPDCKCNKNQETVGEREREREGEEGSAPCLKEISPLSLKRSGPRFIIVAIVCLCSAHAAAASSELSQIQYSNSVSLATLRYPVLLSLTSGATCTSVALRCSHPSHPLHPLPTHAHTDTHTSVHTLKCPFVLQLQRTFLFWPQLIYASFLCRRDFLATFATWLLLGCPRSPSSPLSYFGFCLNALRILISSFFQANAPTCPSPLPDPLRNHHKKSAPQNGWRNGAALVNARCLLFTFNLIIVFSFSRSLSLQKFSLVF